MVRLIIEGDYHELRELMGPRARAPGVYCDESAHTQLDSDFVQGEELNTDAVRYFPPRS
jgi:hypothetical protein